MLQHWCALCLYNQKEINANESGTVTWQYFQNVTLTCDIKRSLGQKIISKLAFLI